MPLRFPLRASVHYRATAPDADAARAAQEQTFLLLSPGPSFLIRSVKSRQHWANWGPMADEL